MPPSYSRRRAPVTLEEAGMSVVVSLCVVGGLFGRFVVGAPWLPRSLPLIDAACNGLDALVSSLVRAAAARAEAGGLLDENTVLFALLGVAGRVGGEEGAEGAGAGTGTGAAPSPEPLGIPPPQSLPVVLMMACGLGLPLVFLAGVRLVAAAREQKRRDFAEETFRVRRLATGYAAGGSNRQPKPSRRLRGLASPARRRGPTGIESSAGSGGGAGGAAAAAEQTVAPAASAAGGAAAAEGGSPESADEAERRKWRQALFGDISYQPFVLEGDDDPAAADDDDDALNSKKKRFLPVVGRLAPQPMPDELRLRLLEDRIAEALGTVPPYQYGGVRDGTAAAAAAALAAAPSKKSRRGEFTAADLEVLRRWASYGKGLRALLLQFSRARPGKDRRRDPFPEASEKRNPSEWAGGNPHWDVEESWLLLRRCVAWRARHDVPTIFRRGYARSERRQLKRRLMNSFFFGSAQGSGEPIYYNNFAQCDPDHADLFEPGRFTTNDMSIVWVQEMEYRERVIFPRRSREEAKLVNHMIVVFDAAGAGMGTRKLLPYLRPTASLNSTYYPESVRTILVVNAPGVVSFLYNFVKPFMPETTQKKVNFVSSNGNAELLALVGDQRLIPADHGGSAPTKAALLDAFEDDIERFLETDGPCASIYDASRALDKTPPDARKRLTEPALADKNLGI